MIAEEVARALAVEPRWRQTVDNDALCRELETRFNIWIGQERALVNNEDHRAWLTAERKEDWRYWSRYRQYAAADLAPSSVEAMDRVTDRVLGLLEDPRREGAWDRRGLVVGLWLVARARAPSPQARKSSAESIRGSWQRSPFATISQKPSSKRAS